MSFRTNPNKRAARQVFDRMLFWMVVRDFRRDKVGAITEKLSPADRKALENLKSEDVQDRI